MKTKLLLFAFLLISTLGFSQKLEVTPNGLRDKANAQNDYLVIKTSNKNAQELFTNAKKYIIENYKNPEKVIKGNIKNEYLKFETYVPQFTEVKNGPTKLAVSMNFTTELRFKDNKVKFEIIDLSITADNGGRNVLFSGSIWKGYPIYKKNGELRLPETKSEIENYFNSYVDGLKKFLNGKSSSNDDW